MLLKPILSRFLLASLPYGALTAQDLPTADARRQAADQHAMSGIPLLLELLRIPNDAHFPEDIEKNVLWCEQAFGQRGFGTQRLETPGAPLLLAEKNNGQALKTLLIYMHLDGQPVEKALWDQNDPWEPVFKAPGPDNTWKTVPQETALKTFQPDWRVFARSASDDKGPVAMFLTALDALESLGRVPVFNIKAILDFEEELGSPHLAGAVSANKDKMQADYILIFDGPQHLSNAPTLLFGARGIATLTLTTYGPVKPQHSGHYGNYVPNPAFSLAQLLASFKHPDGRVAVAGFYDGIVLNQAEKAILALVPDDETLIKQELGIAQPEQVGGNYQESLQYPSLNIMGLSSGWVGKDSRTVVPATATAELDIRLVPASDPEQLFRLIRQHIEKQGFHVTEKAPTDIERQQYAKIISFSGKL